MVFEDVQIVTDATFQQLVLDRSGLVLVDFWAPWCSPCQRLAPTLDAVASELRGTITVVKVNVEENPEAAGRFNIRRIPTLMLFKEGRVVEVLVGLVEKKHLIRVVAASAS
jgi:thioredoxin 1